MLSKTRTTIITLIAAGSFATAAVVPAISQADPASGASAGCPYNGETYATGQRISVISGAHYDNYYCGADGQWHKVEQSRTQLAPPIVVPPGPATLVAKTVTAPMAVR